MAMIAAGIDQQPDYMRTMVQPMRSHKGYYRGACYPLGCPRHVVTMYHNGIKQQVIVDEYFPRFKYDGGLRKIRYRRGV